MPRRGRRKSIAIIMAAGFVALLVMELLAIFSPAFRGSLAQKAEARGLQFKVYTPVTSVGDAEAMARALSRFAGVEASVERVNVSLPSNLSAVVVAVYKDGDPLLVALLRPTRNETALQQLATSLLDVALQAEKDLPSNETLLYFAGQFYRIKRSPEAVQNFVHDVYAQLAAAHGGAGNATGGRAGQQG